MSDEAYTKLNQQLEKLNTQLESNTRLTQETNQILVGQPQYKRKGLVEIVDEHESFLKNVVGRAGGAMLVIFVIWEVVKVTVFRA